MEEKNAHFVGDIGVGAAPAFGSATSAGAASALQQMDAQKPVSSATSRGSGPAAQLHHDLIVFREKALSLPPQEAAHQWLALAERYPDLWKAPRFGSF
jgi:hypothetical protein